ncbi:MAG: aldolase/citrate lyase family protein [Rhodocyclaceae bacterium]|nr:aldolase/citrate lyase family protein [Rhodocyclaceae bacterium]
MSRLLTPAQALQEGQLLPLLPLCEHYCGTIRQLDKAIALQNEWGPIFDITADCEDGAPIGDERAHARAMAERIASADNRHGRIGARIHDIRHHAWAEELDAFLSLAGDRLAYLVLPKADGVSDVNTLIEALARRKNQLGLKRPIPLHVLIETHGALHEAWDIAALAEVESLDFGLMDFISSHHGAIPESAMRSPGQFSHPLIRRAKCEIVAAALAHGKVPTHNVTIEIRDPSIVAADARRAREEFGFLRMWSIHPSQIQPIIDAMRPTPGEIDLAVKILLAAQEADWGPVQIEGRLFDRASYRYHWEVLLSARRARQPLPTAAEQRLFATHLEGAPS